MLDPTPRIIKIGDAISQLINVAFLANHTRTNANESISGRAYRCGWTKTVKVINFVFSPWELDHCKLAYLSDIERAQSILKLHQPTK